VSSQIFGIYKATVKRNDDPLYKQRLILRIPQVLGEADSAWAEVSDPTSSVPRLGDIVWVQFSGGDVTKPVYIANAMGQLRSSSFVSEPPGSAPNEPGDIRWQIDGSGTVVAQWEGLGGTLWVERSLSHAAIAFVEAATITVGTLNVSGVLSVSGSIDSPQVVPTGTISMFGSATAPAGYLPCDGSSQLRASYAALYAVIGSSYGSVDGTQFTLPNFTAAFPRGNTPAANGGAATHAHAQADHQHVVSAHSHTLGDSGWAQIGISTLAFMRRIAATAYSANYSVGSGGGVNSSTPNTGAALDGATDSSGAYWTNGQTTAVNTAAGSSLPPYIGVNFIIKT